MDYNEIIKRAHTLEKEIRQARERLGEMTVEGRAGGGLVIVYANGREEIVAVKISPEVLQEKDVRVVEDLVLAACRQAAEKAKQLAAKEMGKVSGFASIRHMLGL